MSEQVALNPSEISELIRKKIDQFSLVSGLVTKVPL